MSGGTGGTVRLRPPPWAVTGGSPGRALARALGHVHRLRHLARRDGVDRPVAGAAEGGPSPSMLAYRSAADSAPTGEFPDGNEGVFTLPQGLCDKREVNKGGEHDVEFVEAGEDVTEGLEPTEEAFDLVAASVEKCDRSSRG